MNRNLSVLMVLFYAIFVGQVFAGNPAKQLSGKSAAVQMPSFSKLLKGNEKVNKKQKRSYNYMQAVAGTEQTDVSLRSSLELEPGHSRPDSAIYRYNDIDGWKSVFSYKGDTIVETEYRKGHYVYDPEEDYYYFLVGEEWYLPDYSKNEYVFDANGNVIYYYNAYYEDYLLAGADKNEYAYNPNGTPLFQTYYNLEDGEWILQERVTYQYDGSGMLTGGSYYYDGQTYPITVSGTLENLEISIIMGEMVVKFVRHYDPATMKQLAYELYYLEDGGILEMAESGKYIYDSEGRLVTDFYYEGSDYYWKTEYAYNASGQKLSETSYRAYDSDESYTIYDKAEYEYNSGRLIKIVYSGYTDEGEKWIYATTTFFYSGGTGIVLPKAKIAVVSASEGYITFVLPEQAAGATLQLVDISGRTALKAQIVSGQPLAVQSLPSGVYIYHVTAGGSAYNGKIVIR